MDLDCFLEHADIVLEGDGKELVTVYRLVIWKSKMVPNSPIASSLLEFVGQIRHVGEPQSIRDIAWNGKKFGVSGRIDNRSCIVVRIKHDRGGILRSVLPDANSGPVRIVVYVVAEVLQSLQLRWCSAVWVHNGTSPKCCGLESHQIESSDNAKVVVATLERTEEVRVGLIVGVNDLA